MKTRASLLLVALTLVGCGSPGRDDPATATEQGTTGAGSGSVSLDRSCDTAEYPSQEWTACEQANFAKANESSQEFADPDFQARYRTQGTANELEWTQRAASDLSWLSAQSGNTAVLPLCTTWGEQCVGDPFRYPAADGQNGDDFYANEAEVVPVVFYDQACARISGRIWKPRSGNGPFPGVVIQNGSVQAPETLYWWAAQALVRAGYVVMTFDPRGQGRSDQQTPSGDQGSNANPVVFWEGLVNSIDFFRSSEAVPYPHNNTCVDTYPTAVTNSNPFFVNVDHSRLGIAGHSLGGVGVSVVQSYGADGADPWPGLQDAGNPVAAVVAWDGIFTAESGSAGNAGGNAGSASGSMGNPPVVPQFPILGMNGEYGLTPVAFTEPPDPDKLLTNFGVWLDAGVAVYEMTVQGSTHYEWSPLATFPVSSWCPNASEGFCNGGWGNAMAQHYTVAWFDRWLKNAGEDGFADADDRLLDDAGPNGAVKMSFRYRSGRSFPTRNGAQQFCLDVRAGCQ